jgi:hypothetical protein
MLCHPDDAQKHLRHPRGTLGTCSCRQSTKGVSGDNS